MIKYGVWFVGNDQEIAQLCYEGREVFLTSDYSSAEVKANNLAEWFQVDKSMYKICKIEILEEFENIP